MKRVTRLAVWGFAVTGFFVGCATNSSPPGPAIGAGGNAGSSASALGGSPSQLGMGGASVGGGAGRSGGTTNGGMPGGGAGDAPISGAAGAPSVDLLPGAPELIDQAPASGAAGLWFFGPLHFTFSEPLAPDSVNADTISVLTPNGQSLPASISLERHRLALRLQGPTPLNTTLKVTIGAVKDLSGNAFAGTTSTLGFSRWFSMTETANAYPFGDSPSLAAADDNIVLANLAGVAGSRRAQVTLFGAGQPRQLGSPIPSDATLTSKRLELQLLGEEPWLMWQEARGLGQRVFTSHYSSGTWQTPQTLGESTEPFARLATLGGQPLAGLLVDTHRFQLFQSTAAWLPFGPALEFGQDAEILALRLAVSGSRPLVAVAKKAGSILVYQLDNGVWSPLGGPLSFDTNHVPELALAALDNDALLGWTDATALVPAQFQVAQFRNGAWVGLGRALNVDVENRVEEVQLSFDAQARPIAAWAELHPAGTRLHMAQFENANWRHYPPLNERSVGPRAFALTRDNRGQSAVAWQWDQEGALELRRYNGDPSQPKAELVRASTTPCSFPPDGPTFPTLLSQTGCYTDMASRTTSPDLVAYELNSPLWSDGALKRRFFSIPVASTLGFEPEGALRLPIGSVLVKEFWLEATQGVASSAVPMETRFLVKRCEKGQCVEPWQGYSYRWNTGGTDGSLLAADEGGAVPWLLDSGQQHQHFYPTRDQCALCHHSSVGFALGFQAGQLDRNGVFGPLVDNQLEVLDRAGLLDADFMQARSTAPSLPSPADLSFSKEARARSYLHANCSHCHNPQGQRSTIDFRFSAPLASDNICNHLTPTIPATSLILERMKSRQGGQMPPLATFQEDALGVQALEAWISSLNSCP